MDHAHSRNPHLPALSPIYPLVTTPRFSTPQSSKPLSFVKVAYDLLSITSFFLF